MKNAILSPMLIWLFIGLLTPVHVGATATPVSVQDSTIMDTSEKVSGKNTTVRFVKVRDRKTGKKFWLEYENLEDIEQLRQNYDILKTRKNKGRFWKTITSLIERIIGHICSDFPECLLNKDEAHEQPRATQKADQ